MPYRMAYDVPGNILFRKAVLDLVVDSNCNAKVAQDDAQKLRKPGKRFGLVDVSLVYDMEDINGNKIWLMDLCRCSFGMKL